MDPTRQATYQFLDAFLSEMAALFPDPYFHIGGDEVNPKQWKENAQIMGFARERGLNVPEGLHAYFNQRIAAILGNHGKIMIGWDEILHPDLPAGAMIQSWRGDAALADAARSGHPAVLSSGFYLDHLEPASLHYAVDPLGGPAGRLEPRDAARILGGEACMWTENVSHETVESRIWPRMAAIAERFWSPRETADAASMYERMAVVSRGLEWTGVRHRSNYGPMLDRLTGGRPAEPVQTLADASEATGHGWRGQAKQYTSLVPLNRFVDAVRPESELVRAMELAAARWVKDPAAESDDAAFLREQFLRWAANDARFQAVAKGNVFLEELMPLSRDLASVGRAGLRLLAAIEGRKKLPADWVDQQRTEMARLERPQAEVVLAAFRPVKILLDQTDQTFAVR
jgi:hexosaminidase